MSSISFIHSSYKLTDWSNSPLELRPPEPESKAPEAPKTSDRSTQQETARSALAAAPAAVDMRYEFNAVSQTWMLAMTDVRSGDVVRQISLKGFSRGLPSSGHTAGHWIDKAV